MTAMSWDEWSRLDAVAMAGLARSGQVTPRELATQAAEYIDAAAEALAGFGHFLERRPCQRR